MKNGRRMRSSLRIGKGIMNKFLTSAGRRMQGKTQDQINRACERLAKAACERLAKAACERLAKAACESIHKTK